MNSIVQQIRATANVVPCSLKSFIFIFLLVGCGNLESPPGVSPTVPPPVTQTTATSLTLYNWEDDIPLFILERFEQETGVAVEYAVYEAQEDVLAELAGGDSYDVILLDNANVSRAIERNLIIPLDYSIITNRKQVAPNFRNLAHDPQQIYSLPYTWGTIGIAVRTDLAVASITGWGDFWNPTFTENVGIWGDEPRIAMGLALKAAGFSANSENVLELEEAAGLLSLIKPKLVLMDEREEDHLDLMANGTLHAMVAWPEDVRALREQGLQVEYVLPDEGALMWGDNFVIPATSSYPQDAARLINFLMEPANAVEIARYNEYATANEGAIALLDGVYQQDPLIYPPTDDNRADEPILPHSAAGQTAFEEQWQQFVDTE